jgi:hypothetical protein
MSTPIRNRIKCHRRVRAGDLVPHEWNYRLHPDAQKDALLAIHRRRLCPRRTTNERLGMDLLGECSFTLHHRYDNKTTISFGVPERPYVAHLVGQASLTSDTVNALREVTDVRGLIEALEGRTSTPRNGCS